MAKSEHRFSTSARKNLAGPALRVFFQISARWGLTSCQQRQLLGRPARSTFYGWKRKSTGLASWDVLERISYVLGIYQTLHCLFTNGAQADGWIRRPNSASLFAGSSALDRMLAGQVADLFVVRQYLESQVWGD